MAGKYIITTSTYINVVSVTFLHAGAKCEDNSLWYLYPFWFHACLKTCHATFVVDPFIIFVSNKWVNNVFHLNVFDSFYKHTIRLRCYTRQNILNPIPGHFLSWRCHSKFNLFIWSIELCIFKVLF